MYRQALPSILVALAAFSFAACSKDDNHNAGVDASSGTGGSAGSGTAGASGSSGRSPAGADASSGAGTAGTGAAGRSDAGLDAQVPALSPAAWIDVLDTANSGEATQGNLAAMKGQASTVTSFGTQMFTDHTAGLAKDKATATQLGITPMPNAVSASLKQKSDALVAELRSLSGAAFDRTYMRAQVDEHRAVLALLDAAMVQSGTNAATAATGDTTAAGPLQTLLSSTREVVQMHLTMAEEVLAALP